MNATRRAVFFRLVRHFLRQFVSFETLATGGELKHAAIAVLSLLAGPGYFVALATYAGLTRRLIAGRGRVPPLLLLWNEEWLVFTLSFAAVVVLVSLQWRGFALSERDFRILGVLPLRRRTVMAAKLAAVAVAVLVLHLAVNTLACTFLPLSSPVGVGRMARAMHAALLVQTVFACFAVVALQGLARLASPAALGRRLAPALQFGLLIGAALLVVARRDLSRLTLDTLSRSEPSSSLLPLAWFMGFYKHLLGADTAPILAQARSAWLAAVLAAAVALPCCLLGYSEPRPAAAGRAGRRLRLGSRAALWPRRPVARGVCQFVVRCALRCETPALLVGAWLAVGLAVTLAGFGGTLLRGGVLLGPPTAATVSPAIVLCFFGLVGLRLSATYPAHLGANWVFRMTEQAGQPRAYAKGVRAAAIRLIVAPILGALFVPAAWVWGLLPALLHTAFAAALALLTIEGLFASLSRIPFTCSYRPGKANLRATWPLHAALAILYCGLLPELAARALERPLVSAALTAALLGGRELLARRHRRHAPPLLFDDEAPPVVTGLGL